MNAQVSAALHRMRACGRRISELYVRLFSIEELANSRVLQWFSGAMLLFFFLTFSRWIGSSLTTVETAERGMAVCWPYFQNCYEWYFLHQIPNGYSQSAFYMLFYGLFLLAAYYIWKRQWSAVHALMLLMFVWKALVVFVLSYTIAGPYDYYHLFLMAILLFVPLKEYFLKLAFVFFYFMSVTVKFDATWILGTYFSSLSLGLPLFPDVLTPLFTNLVIFMQVVGCWFLLSKRVVLQRLALLFFVTFHLYSGIFVYYVYPTISLPPLLILFGPLYRHHVPPLSRKAIAGWTVIVLIALFQLVGFLIPGERRLTLEGNRYGMFMFEANHQCVATMTMYSRGTFGEEGTRVPGPGNGCSGFYCVTERSVAHTGTHTISTTTYESPSAWNRCDPYEWWAKLHTRCDKNPEVERIALRFDHSINGGPFYRIIDVPNICKLSYKAFGHNEWIRMPPEAPLVGYPLENDYDY